MLMKPRKLKKEEALVNEDNDEMEEFGEDE